MYHLDICLHRTNVAHFKTDIILDIYIEYHLHTTVLGDICCSLHRMCQYCAKRLHNGNNAYEPLLVHLVYHLNICAPVSDVAIFKADNMPIVATKYHLPTM